MPIPAAVTIWLVAGVAAMGIVLRPFRLPEWASAMAGAALLVALRLVSPHEAIAGIGAGTDVYLFLIGMMLLAATARREGLFDWLAAVAARHARGSPVRLFLLTYAVATVVTVFLSNDATAVVLTPAVAAAVRTAKARDPLPYLLVCAFTANAASFVLPISNPANLVVYGPHIPPLAQWLPRYLLPSALAIAATCVVLWWTQRTTLAGAIAKGVPRPALSAGGRIAASGIAATAAALLAASAMGWPLGLPTALAGAATAALVLCCEKKPPWTALDGITWGILPMVAGLFVLVEALDKTGLIATLRTLLLDVAAHSVGRAAWSAGVAAALCGNLANNLPVGLVAGSVLQGGNLPEAVGRAVLIGVDLGPNLSVTGSLATILWLAALRREAQAIGALRFLQLGLVVMPPALVSAIAAALYIG